MTEPTTYPLSVEGVTEALRTLDVESWELAELLAAAGVRGVQNNECACPIAVLLGRLIPVASAVHVEQETVRVVGTVRDDLGFDWPVVVSSTLPDGGQDFVEEFDRGEHPLLIEEVSEHA